MQFTKFSRTGLTVSRLCLGTGTFGKQTDEAESCRVFDKAADAGVNFLDTADVYPGGADLPEVGRAEEITGLWLKAKRNRFILGTKAGGPMGSALWDRSSSRKHLLDAIDASLRRLNTDYVDLYQLHMDDPATPLDETAEALDAIIHSGKARYIGVSNFLAYRLARAIGRQDTLRLVRFVSVQPRYNLLFREIERELLPLAQEENLAVIPFNPLAGGLLSGKYRQDDKPERDAFRRKSDSSAPRTGPATGINASSRRSAGCGRSPAWKAKRCQNWLSLGFWRTRLLRPSFSVRAEPSN
jgi:aryl-alcohol dehydrogenase-like predicted oxidoreductase